MVHFNALSVAFVALTCRHVYATPVSTVERHDWQSTLSEDTRTRLGLARGHLDDYSVPGQAFRNDTMMRINLEREAQDLSLIDLSQAFGNVLPALRATVAKAPVDGTPISPDQKAQAVLEGRNDKETFREEAYLRSGGMTIKRSDKESLREDAYLRSGGMTIKRDQAEKFREEAYLRSGGMTIKRNDKESLREEAYLRSGGMTIKRGEAESLREEAYLRSGGMTIKARTDKESLREDAYLRSGGITIKARDRPESLREEAYLRSGGMTIKASNNAETFREDAYLRSGGMTIKARNNAESLREDAYLRSGGMTIKARGQPESLREEAYLRSGGMTIKARDDGDVKYSDVLDRDNLALGAMERLNIVHRILGEPELTLGEVKEVGSHGNDFMSNYWNSSMKHGDFWETDQAEGRPNFIEGGQDNGFGFTQSTFHKLHCLSNLRMMLSWQITGHGENMSRDMNMHAIHCLEYIRYRELRNPDLTEEPIDTVDYKGMGIH